MGGAILNTLQAALGNTNPWVLYALVAVTNAGFAVISPARSAIYPRLLPLHLLPAANALNVGAMNAALTVGPLLAGVLIDRSGYVLTYGLDAVLFAFAMWGLARLGPVPPEPDADGDDRAPGPGPAQRARRAALPQHPTERPHDLPRRLLRDDPRPAAGPVPGRGPAWPSAAGPRWWG